jgi:hypothetical protein
MIGYFFTWLYFLLTIQDFCMKWFGKLSGGLPGTNKYHLFNVALSIIFKLFMKLHSVSNFPSLQFFGDFCSNRLQKGLL